MQDIKWALYPAEMLQRGGFWNSEKRGLFSIWPSCILGIWKCCAVGLIYDWRNIQLFKCGSVKSQCQANITDIRFLWGAENRIPLNIQIQRSVVSVICVAGVCAQLWDPGSEKDCLSCWNAQEEDLWSSSSWDKYLKKCCHVWGAEERGTQWCTISWAIYLSVELDIRGVNTIYEPLPWCTGDCDIYFLLKTLACWAALHMVYNDRLLLDICSDIMSCTWSYTYQC